MANQMLAEVEKAVLAQLAVEQVAHQDGIAPEQVEHEALEIRGLGDVHRRR